MIENMHYIFFLYCHKFKKYTHPNQLKNIYPEVLFSIRKRYTYIKTNVSNDERNVTPIIYYFWSSA